MKNQMLWDQLKGFTIGKQSDALGFVKRLARENAWSMHFAQRVYKEYLKFVYLASVSRSIVTPSDQVDQAWHLHLSYTRSYWDHLCETVLKTKLHHEPTQGGRKEGSKYFNCYSQTLDLYQAEFGHQPPSDIWPTAKSRFTGAGLFKRINLGRHYVLNKKKARTLSATFMTALILISCTKQEAGAFFFSVALLGFVVVTIIVSRVKSHGNDDTRSESNKKEDSQNGSASAGCSNHHDSGCGGCGGCGG